MIGGMHLDIGDLTKAIVDDILKFAGNQPLADDLCLVAVEAVRNEAQRSVQHERPERQIVES